MSYFDDVIADEVRHGVQRYAHSYWLQHEVASDTCVVLIHGHVANPSITREFGEALYADGVDVYGARLAGHGSRSDDLKRVQWLDWVTSVERPVLYLKRKYARVVLVGNSTGALVVLDIASRISVAGIVCMATFLNAVDKRFYWGYLVGPVMKALPFIDFGDVDSGFIEPGREQFWYARRPLYSIVQLLKFVNHVKRIIPNVTCPIRIIHTKSDDTAHPSSADYLNRHVGSGQKELNWCGTEHPMFVDRDPAVLDTVKSFVFN